MAERYTKTYVSVNVDIDEDGTMLPRLIRWMNGRVFAIEQLGYKCRVLDEGGGRRHPLYRPDKRPGDLPVSGGQPVVRGGQGLRRTKNFYRHCAANELALSNSFAANDVLCVSFA